MEWFKIALQFVGTLVWPAVILTIVMIFRRELRGIIGSIKEVKYPGGSVTMEVALLEERIGRGGILSERSESLSFHRATLPSVADPQLAIAQMRTDVERELLRLSWHFLDSSSSEQLGLDRRIDELQTANAITLEFANSLRDFIRLANSVIHGAEVATDVKTRLTSVGASIVSQLHYQRKVSEAMREFDGDLLWHAHRHHKGNRNYYFWSAMAATLPEIDYSYEIYREAAERHKQKLVKAEHVPDAEEFYVLPLDEFVQVLEFRESELLRLIETWHQHKGDSNNLWKAFEKANYWQWPSNWGGLGWNGPIIRHGLTIFAAEDDLVQTRSALNRYRMKLLRGATR